MVKIIIIRHSYRDDNVNKHLYSDNINNNCPLSIDGFIYAKEKSYILKKMIKTLDLIYTSPFLRAKQTASLFQKTFNCKSEVCYNLSEGQNKEKPNYNKDLVKELENNNIKIPETINDIKYRCKILIDKLITNNKNKNILLVTHGIIYNYLLTYIFKDYVFSDINNSADYIPKCCDLSIISYDKNFTMEISEIKNLNKLKI